MNVHTGTVVSGEARLYYETAGSGPAVVFVHAGVADSRMWDLQFAQFSADFTVVRWDQRGCGKSPRAPGAFTRHQDLRAVLHSLDIARAAVVGASVGGKTALDFALTYPDHTAALVLVAPSVSGYQSPRYPSLDAIDAAEERGDIATAVELELRLWVDGPRRAPDQVEPRIRELVRDMNTLTYQPGPAGEEVQLEQPALRRLSGILAPTLVVVGDSDQPDRIDLARRVGRDIRGARTAIVPDAAHLVNMERPQQFNDLVLDFLRGSVLRK
jgi:pimeloyl-ACP methyl ester carboxylesterase